LIDGSGYPLVGFYTLPVFQGSLSESIVAYLSDGEVWDVLDSINEDLKFE